MESPKHYEILTGPLLNKYSLKSKNKEAVYENAASELVERVKTNEIWFPFQKYFRGNPATLFATLKTIDLPIENGNYELRSYYPTYKSYLPPKFRGSPITISGDRNTYEIADVLSDHFIEHIRLKAKRYDQNQSILDCWTIEACLKGIFKAALDKDRITPATLRDTIYKTHPETKIFNPTWARAVLKLVMGPNLAGKKWLDISAGWGDRLLAAMSLDMNYVGFDPNIELQAGHSAMIESFGDPNRHQIIYEPFEKANIPDGPYDVIFTSPPYYTVEEYVPGQEGQSIVSYPKFNQWMAWFLFASLSKAWDNLKEGGYLIIHLGDTQMIHISEPTNIYIENYLQGASWEGVIGLKGELGYPRPVWVWKKVAKGTPQVVWEPEPLRYAYNKYLVQKEPLRYAQRTLYNTYPELQAELVNFYAAKYSPNYVIRKNNANAIRGHVGVNLPKISHEAIDKILNDDLMISSLLETLGVQDTIKWATAMVQLAFPR